MIDCFKDVDLNKIVELNAVSCKHFHECAYYDIFNIVHKHKPKSNRYVEEQLTDYVWVETYNLLDLDKHRHKIGKMYLLCKNAYSCYKSYEKYTRFVVGICIQLGAHKFEIDVLQKGYTEDMFEHMKSSIKECLIETSICKKLMKL